MLTCADRKLCERDSGLPGLQTLLDSHLLEDAIRASSETFPLPVEFPAPDYLRYEPGRRCLALYTEAGERVPFAYARADRTPTPGSEDCPEEPPWRDELKLAGVEVSVFAFPSDRRMRALSRLAEGGGRRRRLLRAVLPDRKALHRIAPVLLRYRPERRAVFRLGPPAAGSVVLKLYRKGGFARTVSRLRALTSTPKLQLPLWVGSSEPHRLLAFDWLDGPVLRDGLRTRLPDLAAVAETGAALAELHGQAGQGLPLRSEEEEVDQVRRTASVVGQLAPDQAARARALADEVAGGLTASRADRVPIHGDFYDNQVIVMRDRVALLDLDEATIGNRLEDLGLFIAHLERDVLLGTLPSAVGSAARSALLEGYCATTPGTSISALPLHIAKALIGLGPSVFRKSRDRWPGQLGDLLDRAAAELTVR
jgi:aminoglycoside phosphotransferase (APT) family kinase protein